MYNAVGTIKLVLNNIKYLCICMIWNIQLKLIFIKVYTHSHNKIFKRILEAGQHCTLKYLETKTTYVAAVFAEKSHHHHRRT